MQHPLVVGHPHSVARPVLRRRATGQAGPGLMVLSDKTNRA